MLSLSISYNDFLKIHDFGDKQPGGDEASIEGCNSGPTGHDFTDNSNTPYVMPN
jgi:hypothetical protein